MNPRPVWSGVALAAALLTVSPALATVTRNDRIPIEQFRINDCTGGVVVLNGVMHLQERLMPSGLIETQINVHWTGTGSDGNTYVLNSQHKHEQAPGLFAEVFRDRLISTGGAPNQHVFFRASTEAPQFEFTLDCRG